MSLYTFCNYNFETQKSEKTYRYLGTGKPVTWHVK